MPSSPPSARGALTSARWFPFVILGIGLTAISFGAILARIAQAEGVSSLAVASWRLGFAALIITPVALLQARHELTRLTRRQLVMALTAGGPGFSTDVPATFMYTMSFSRGQIGLGAASATMMLATVAALVIPYLYSELRSKPHDR